jgi:hypothetical protein
MDKFTVDLNNVASRQTRPKVYRLDDVADQIEKVAFDVVRFKEEDDSTKLWQIQDTPDGKVIVSLYDVNAEPMKTESEWRAIPDKQASVHIFRNGEPVVRLAAEDLGVPEEEVSLLCQWLPKKLSESKELQRMILKRAALATYEDIGYAPPLEVAPEIRTPLVEPEPVGAPVTMGEVDDLLARLKAMPEEEARTIIERLHDEVMPMAEPTLEAEETEAYEKGEM